MKLRHVLFIPDSHVPFECLVAYRLLYLILKDVKIDLVVLLGDFLDMYGLSFYDQDPSFGDVAELYQREIECGKQRLEEIKELTNGVQLHYIEGNHEDRLTRYMAKNAKALRKRLSVPSELELDRIKRVTWHPFNKTQSLQIYDLDLYARHCPPVGGTALNVAKQSGASVIYGHTHQESTDTFINKMTAKKTVAHNAGCLVDFEAKVFNYVPTRPNWSKAFTIATIYKKDFWLETIRIHDNTASFRGKLYETEVC